MVSDYRIAADGTLVSTGDQDSTDAYAGTFLSAVKDAWLATPAPDRARRLAEVAPGIDGALRAISAVTRPDGLTWAKPTWHVVYLMDQAETFDGLKSAAVLLTAMGRYADATKALDAAARMAVAVDRLWNPTTNSYDWAVHESGVHQATDWGTLYPDTLQNAWVVAYGLVPAKRATALMSKVSAEHPELADATAAGYWPQAATAYLAVKDTARASAVLSGVAAQATATNRAWPYHVAVAGVSLSVTYGP